MLDDKENRIEGDDQPKKRRRVRLGDAQERTPYRSSDIERTPKTLSSRGDDYQSRPQERERTSFDNRERRESPFGTNTRPYDGGERKPYQSREGAGYQQRGGDNYQQRGYQQRDDNPGYRPYNNGQDQRRPQQQKPRFNSPRQDSANRGKRLVKPIKYKENVSPETEIRLNKYLSNAGVASRREADTHISAGAVKVNGVVVTELGTRITYGDEVTFHDKKVEIESKVYVLLNKPKNCVTTSDDPQNRLTVMDLVKNACTERIYPVGRLDRNTTGVLLLTNDGDLASKLMHPKFKKKKIYQVTLDKDVPVEDMQTIADGIELDDGFIQADSIAYNSEDKMNVVGIEIHSGRNRVVRRIFEKLGYKVIRLDRVYFSGLTKKNLPRGKWRYLEPAEVNILRMGAFE